MWLEWTGVDTFRAHSGHSGFLWIYFAILSKFCKQLNGNPRKLHFSRIKLTFNSYRRKNRMNAFPTFFRMLTIGLCWITYGSFNTRGLKKCINYKIDCSKQHGLEWRIKTKLFEQQIIRLMTRLTNNLLSGIILLRHECTPTISERKVFSDQFPLTAVE